MKVGRITALVAALVFICVVQGCGGSGGGGSGGGGSIPLEKAQGESYLAHGEDLISSVQLQFDIDGMLQLDDGLLTFKPSAAPSGCSMTPTPADADLAVCNPLVQGKAFIVCDNTSSVFFKLALFNSKDIQTAPLSELAGMTLQGVSCGDTGVRSTTQTVSFSPDATSATVFTGNGGSSGWSGSYFAAMASPAGVQYMTWQRRWATYKLATPSGTEYFLLELYERFDERDPINQSRIFRVQKPL